MGDSAANLRSSADDVAGTSSNPKRGDSLTQWDDPSERVPSLTVQGVTNQRFQWTPGILDAGYGLYDIGKRVARLIK